MTDYPQTTTISDMIAHLATGVAQLNAEIAFREKQLTELNGSKKVAEDMIAYLEEVK